MVEVGIEGFYGVLSLGLVQTNLTGAVEGIVVGLGIVAMFLEFGPLVGVGIEKELEGFGQLVVGQLDVEGSVGLL